MPSCRASSPRGRLGGLLAAVLLLAALPRLPALTVAFSSSLNGNLDGCTCPQHPRAGLVTRAAWLRALPERGHLLLVDAGDILDTQPDPDLAREILDAYSGLGYDVVAVGDQEFSLGIEPLAALREGGLFLANNLMLCQGDRCLYYSLEPRRLEKDGETVGVIALLDPQVFYFYPEELTRNLKFEAPERVAEGLVRTLRQQGIDWVVVLYHGTVEDAERLARQVSGIDLIIAGHEQRLVPPRKVGDTFLASPGEEGNRVGLITLRRTSRKKVQLQHEFRLFNYRADPKDPALQERIQAYRKRLRDAINKQS